MVGSRRERRARGTKRKTKGKRSSQFGKRQSLREGVLVCRKRKRRPQVQVRFSSLENCRRLRGCSCVEGANERRLHEKSIVFGEQSLLRECSCFEASERKRGCLHVESAINSKERKGDSTERGTERTKRKSGFEAGRQKRRRRSL